MFCNKMAFSTCILTIMVLSASVSNAENAGGNNPFEWTLQAEQERYAYSVAAERDEALKRWCATGFGPEDLCSRGRRFETESRPTTPTPASTPPPGPPPPPVVQSLDPVVREIMIMDRVGRAVLVFPDGTEMPVKVNDRIGDATITEISVAAGVEISINGEKRRLRRRGASASFNAVQPRPSLTGTSLIGR